MLDNRIYYLIDYRIDYRIDYKLDYLIDYKIDYIIKCAHLLRRIIEDNPLPRQAAI